ncbi:MAG: TetR family transcriptional regulator [Candidatus Aminicenantes bacterium]|nr:TetR family transcriptional regulator [Candidatus Aminicenantes bacterium]MDH5743344.1 TetR family transcriptional regulator [Candidatus Aminicenantes bacterium]
MKGMDNLVPKKRILEAAVSLFAQKGFAAVGVREIAAEAGVNIAMISYYFEGKVGILKDILEEFFDRYSLVFEGVDDESKAPEECVRDLIHNLINFVRKNTDLTMVSYNELPLEIPEIADLKAKRITATIQKISPLIRRMELDPQDTFLIAVVGPGLISTIFTNFRFRPVLKRVFKFKFDDSYYERYSETIATLFLNGIKGLIAEKKRQERRKK